MREERGSCALAALGIVNALGRSAEEIWPRLLAGDQSHFRAREDWVPGRSLLVGEVSGPLPPVPDRLRAYACRNNAMTLAALESIEKRIADEIAAVGRERVAVVIGTTTSGVSDAEAAIRHRHATGRLGDAFHYAQLELGGAAGIVAELLGITGPCYTISTACSSGARALASARSLLAHGVCDAVVAGATDSLCGLTANGFTALQAISDAVTNPCSAHRQGLTLGEGSVIFLATRDPGGIRLLGVGESCDAHHMSAPEPEGLGAERAMRAALADAGTPPGEIAYLNLHGTGTPLNDLMECSAVARVFGDPPPMSSTKPLVGHTLGAAGAMEAAFCWLALRDEREGTIPLIPHVFDGELDPKLPPVNLARRGARVAAGPVLSNSFGFGGNNCSLVLGREAA